ncbi:MULTISPECIES: DUF5131 family protein [unclassified Rhizobium]
MADKTHIEWTDATWNPITGCSVVGPGCKHCYAMKLAGTRLKNHPSRSGLTIDTKAGPVWTGEVRFNPQWLDQPLRWRSPRMIFVCAHSDLFHTDVPDEWIDKVFAVMALAPHHIFQVLTKRPERMRAYIRDDATYGRILRAADELRAVDPALGNIPISNPQHAGFWPQLWLGVSVEDQPHADERIPVLLDTPAAVHWISAEPLLGALDVRAFIANSWKCRDPIRDWSTFRWPDWVPESARRQVEDFWKPEWDRGPNTWIRGAIENGQPPLGTRGAFRTLRQGEPLVEGRFVPAWNNIGRVVTDDGSTHCVSAGTYQSQPARLDWVVVGGESGDGARPMDPDWARSLRDQCAAADVPHLFKQWGNWRRWDDVASGFKNCSRFDRLGNVTQARARLHPPYRNSFVQPEGDFPWRGNFLRFDKAVAGRLLDGVEHNGYPPLPPSFLESRR